MQKGFIFLLIIWNSSHFASGNTGNQLQFLLGCQAVIPCQHDRSDSNSFKWRYKKDKLSEAIQLFFQDKSGVAHHQQHFRPRKEVLRNRSLVIKDLREDDEGLYWCENCFQEECPKEEHKVISVKKAILKQTNKTVYVTQGSSFTHACPAEFTNLKWTFEASNLTAPRSSAQRPGSDFVTSNKSIHVVNVKRANVGKYTCWTSGCNGQRQKLFTVNLCIITVHHSGNSSVSCAVMCDMEFSNIRPNSTSNVETDTRNVSVDPYGFLNCSTKQMFDGYSTINSTHRPSNTSSKTTDFTDISTEPEYLIPVVYGTSAALTFLIVIALLICFLRRRLQAAFPAHLCCCGRVEEEPSLVYSSIIIRGPAKTRNNRITYSECVYSEIKV